MLEELQSAFRFNDAVIRNLIIERDGPETEPSPLIRSRDERSDRDDSDNSDNSDNSDSSDSSDSSDNAVEVDDEAAS